MWQEIQEFLQIHPEQRQPVLFTAGLSATAPIGIRWRERGEATRKQEAAASWRKGSTQTSCPPPLLQWREWGQEGDTPAYRHERYAGVKAIGKTCCPAFGRMDPTWKLGGQGVWAGEGLGRGCWIKAPPQFKVSVAVTRSSRSRQATPSSCSEWPLQQLMLWNVSKWMFNMRTKCSPKSNHPVLEWEREKRGEPPHLARIAIFPPFFFLSFESFKRDVFNCSSTTIAFSFAILSFPPEETRESSVLMFNFFPLPFGAFK